MDLFEAIKTRRSIRQYKPDPVSEKDLEAILDAARLAPSWSNTQCWRFVVVRDPSIKTRLAGTLLENNRGIEAILQAPVAIVVCAEMDKSGIYHGKPTSAKIDWFMFDIGIAMEHIALAACSLGLGTVHLGAFENKEVETILGVPDGYRVVSMTPLGYPANQQLPPRPRKTLADIVYYNKFGTPEVKDH